MKESLPLEKCEIIYVNIVTGKEGLSEKCEIICLDILIWDGPSEKCEMIYVNIVTRNGLSLKLFFVNFVIWDGPSEKCQIIKKFCGYNDQG